MAATPYREREPRTPARERETGCESPQRRPRDEPLEQPAEHAVVEERARRERRPRAVQDEEDPLSAQARREGRDAREQVTRSVRDHDVGGADLTPEQSPAADRKRPARRFRGTAWERSRRPAPRPSEAGRRGRERASPLRGGVAPRRPRTARRLRRGEARSSRRSTRVRGVDFPGVGAHAMSAPRSRRGRGVPVFPRTRPPGTGHRRRRGRRRAGRGASHLWAHSVLPCWAIPMRCE